MTLALFVSRSILQFPQDGLIRITTLDEIRAIHPAIKAFVEEFEGSSEMPDYEDPIELWQDSTMLPGLFFLRDVEGATESEQVH